MVNKVNLVIIFFAASHDTCLFSENRDVVWWCVCSRFSVSHSQFALLVQVEDAFFEVVHLTED